jgi:hypothetical protein
MAPLDDLTQAAESTLTAGATTAPAQGVALAADYENLLRPNLQAIVVQLASITEACVTGTISKDLAELNLNQQFEQISDLAVAESELVLLAVQNIINAVINARKRVISTATTQAIGVGLV